MIIELYVWGVNKLTCFLVLLNPIFIKIFQCCSFYQTPGLIDYNSKAPHHDNEIDYNAIYKYDVTLGNVIGSGMVSIVFDATLNENGTHVVVKVKRKGIDKKLIRGCFVIQQFISVCKWFNLYMFLFEIAFDQNISSIIDQLDYRKEVANQVRFKRLFPDAVVPTVIAYDDKVIIMQKLIGLDDCDKIPYAESLVRLAITNILFGFMHSDLHGGNLLLMPNNQLGVIDFGVMIQLNSQETSCIISLLMSMNSDNHENITNVFLTKFITYNREPNESERKRLFVSINEVTKNLISRTGVGINVSDLNKLNKIIRNYDATLKPFLCKCMLGLIAVESSLTDLNPNWSSLLFSVVKSLSEEITSLSEEITSLSD